MKRDTSCPTRQPSSPVASNVTQDQEIDVGEELTVQATTVTSEGSIFSVLEALPPPIKGKRVKKIPVFFSEKA